MKLPWWVDISVLRSNCNDLTQFQDLTLPCDPKYGDEFCYTMITVEPANKTAANTGKVIVVSKNIEHFTCVEPEVEQRLLQQELQQYSVSE